MFQKFLCTKSMHPLSLIAVSLALLSPSLAATDGPVFPDSAQIQCTFQSESNVVTIVFSNLASEPIQRLVVSHHSALELDLLECNVDGVSLGSVVSEVEFSTVVPDWFTTRWPVGDFVQTVTLQYRSPAMSGDHFNWSAARSFPVFGWGVLGEVLCCSGRVGNANGIGTYPQEVTIGDIQTLVMAKFVQGTCDGFVPCIAEGDVNQSGGTDPTCNDITISDIAMLVNHLFIAGPVVAPLNECL